MPPSLGFLQFAWTRALTERAVAAEAEAARLRKELAAVRAELAAAQAAAQTDDGAVLVELDDYAESECSLMNDGKLLNENVVCE